MTYVGNVAFEDAMEPRAAKSDWGIDTLQRKMKGASTLLAAYLATLTQVQVYFYNGQNYYLQTWDPDDDPVFATVTLAYKGLRSGIPAPSAADETTVNTTSVGADVTSLNITNADDVAAKTATRDIEFYSPQTTYKYISSGRPGSTSHNTIANGRTASIIRSIIRLDNGIEYRGNAPVDVVTALDVTPSIQVLGPHVDPIYGTPYFECQDVVQHGYWV